LPKYEQELVEVKKKQKLLKDSVVSEEKFLKLMQTIVDYICNLKDLEQINEILEKFYSNFVVKDKAIAVIEFNPEWYEVLNPTWLGIQSEFRTTVCYY
jgi:DNA integrity scanning protein DisA with diadenylate cyclase activity